MFCDDSSKETSQAQENYEYDDVLDYDEKENKYLVKWHHFKVVECSWEPDTEDCEFSKLWGEKTTKEKNKCKAKYQKAMNKKQDTVYAAQGRIAIPFLTRHKLKKQMKNKKLFHRGLRVIKKVKQNVLHKQARNACVAQIQSEKNMTNKKFYNVRVHWHEDSGRLTYRSCTCNHYQSVKKVMANGDMPWCKHIVAVVAQRCVE
jgi:hypothetical protein